MRRAQVRGERRECFVLPSKEGIELGLPTYSADVIWRRLACYSEVKVSTVVWMPENFS